MKLKKMNSLNAPHDINSHPDNVREWVEIVSRDGEDIRWRLDMTFLLSHYGCKFGECPGVRPGAVDPSLLAGCCTEQVHLDSKPVHPDGKSDPERINALIGELDDTMWSPSRRRLYESTGKWGVNEDGENPRMRVSGGRCIFANDVPKKEGDPPAGCAFHHLANAKGVSHVETKPLVCWMVPFLEVVERDDDDDDYEFRSLSASSRGDWGGGGLTEDILLSAEEGDPEAVAEATDPFYISWWCIDTPDAYNADEPVYISAKHELRAILGKKTYKALKKIAQDYERRTTMPGEKLGNGAPTIATTKSLFASIRANAGRP